MDINLSDSSFAYSDIVGPSHVSGLESFSDFDASEFSECFEDHEAHDSGVEEEVVTPKTLESSQNENSDDRADSFSFGLHNLPTGDIREFLNALESAKVQLGIAIDSQEKEVPVQDESSLGILHLDSLQESCSFGSGRSSSDLFPLTQENYKSKNEKEKQASNDEEGVDLPFAGEYSEPLALSQLPENKTLNEKSDLEEQPHSFFHLSTQEIDISNKTNNAVSNLPNESQSQVDLQFMLQTTRSGSGDGGELIDRVSLTSSISFLQSQTFPESVFSQSLSSYSRGSGSGTDSGSGSDKENDQRSDTDDQSRLSPDLLHDTGDGSNGQPSSSVGRPGLEGANSDPEDNFAVRRPSSDVGGSVAGSIELRQSGEGDDVMPDLPGDGGGGGDGSSGHNSDDNQPIGSGQPSSGRSTPTSSISSNSDHYVPMATPQIPCSSAGGPEMSSNRGLPVGHASVDGSPPSHAAEYSSTSLHQFDVLASSTPMVTSGKNAFNFESLANGESSAIGSQYLLATHPTKQGNGVTVAQRPTIQQQNGSFHLSQILENSRTRDDHENTLTEVASIDFEAQGLTPRPTVQNMSDDEQDKTLTAKTPARDNLITSNLSEGLRGSDIFNLGTSIDSSIGLQGSFLGAVSKADNSLLWKSTPRVEEETNRATPSIVFEGNTRPSPVTEEQDDRQNDDVGLTGERDVRKKTELNVQGGPVYSSGLRARILHDDSSVRLQTPGGSEEQTIPFSSWTQDSRYSSTVAGVYNPFDNEASIGQNVDWTKEQDLDFTAAGDPEAILAADEKSFENEHKFDAPVNASPADITNNHNWTIPDNSGFLGRSSLAKIVAVNDPDDKGEVRISFGQFIAAGSEELGTLHSSDPDRPRPHFGDGHTINTPSPQPPPRLISRDSEKLEEYFTFQDTPNKQTNIKEPKNNESNIPLVKKAPKSYKSRQGSTGSTQQDDSVFEIKKTNLKDQLEELRFDSTKERRGSQSSTQSSHSSHSSSSKGSVQSVIRKKDKKQRKRSEESTGDPKRQQQQHPRQREPDGCPNKENTRGPGGSLQSSSKNTNTTMKDKTNGSSSRVKHGGGSSRIPLCSTSASSRNVLDEQDKEVKTTTGVSLDSQSHGSARSHQRSNVSRQQKPVPKPKDQLISSLSDLSDISTKNTESSLSSILTLGSVGSLNQHELAEFIAKAINISPEHIEKLLAAASEAKSREHYSVSKDSMQLSPVKDIQDGTKCDQTASHEEIETINKSPEREKLSSIKPIASSSPQDLISSPTSVTSTTNHQGLSSPANVQCTTLDSMMSPSQDMISSYSIDSSVFVQDSPENVSVIENSTIVSLTKDTLPSPPSDPFSDVRVDPFFGKTYTIKDKNGTNRDMVEPTKSKANNIEHRLDESSLTDQELSRRSSADFQPVASMTAFSVCSEDDTLIESPDKYTPKKLERSFDSVVYIKSPNTEGKSRHSWPKTSLDSPYKEAEVIRNGFPVSSNPPVLSISSESGMRPVTLGVLPQSAQPQALPVISPVALPSTQFPGQTGAFGYPGPQRFGLQSGGYVPNMNGPLSGTFPMHYTAFPRNAGPSSLNTMLGQVPNQVVQQQYPSNMYPPDGYSAPGFLGPGTVSVGHQTQQAPPYGAYTDNMHGLHLNTVSASLAPRLATITQGFPWQGQGHVTQTAEQGQQQQLQTAPAGLLQLGQPMALQGRTTSTTDSQLPNLQNRTSSSLTPIVIPGEVKLPPVCPVALETRSLLTLHNSSSKWIYCMVKVAYCTVNGAQVTNSVDNPFFVPSRLIINPHTTIPVEVIFKPRLAGLHTAQLHVTSSPVASDGQQTTETLPSLVALEAVAEQPDIEILSEDSQVVDFGEMVANSKHSRPLRLINKGKAAIPIRLTITPNATSLHCFSFVNADTSPKKASSSTPPKTAALNKGILSIHKLVLSGNQAVNGSIDPHVIWILFQAPQKTDPGQDYLGLPDEFTARVDVEMDCDEGPIIGSVLLKATVGVARLHTPKNVQALTLSGVVGQRISRTFPLRNAGNINLQVDLKILKDIECFTVTPSTTVLRPQQEVEVTVQFKPSKADSVIDSTLVMCVLPDGPKYDVLLRGMATSEKKIPSKEESAVLLCNKPVVCWGGVAIGKAVQEKVVLKHNGLLSSKKLKLQLSIQGQHSDFQLQNTFGKVDEKSLASIVSLEPQEELLVHILFAPSSLGLISGALVIRTLSGGTKSKVPLYGCGGSSDLVIADTRKLSEGYISNIGEVSLGKKNVVKLTVKNTGTRPAFVKVVCYSDVPSQTLYPASHLNIAPNNFVLPERTSKQLVVVYQPLENDAIRCKTEMSTVATLAFYTGDEGIRQQYKRYVQRNDLPHTAAKCSGPLMNVDFLTPFQDEDKVIEDVVYPQVPKWTQFFQSCVSRVLLMLVGSPPSVSDKAEANRSLDLVPMQGPSENGPPALTKVPPVLKPEVVDNKNPDAWTVLPEHLVLTAYKTLSEKGTGRLQIINFSDRPLMFEFIWPAHCLAITPDRGQIPSRSQVMVVMSPRPTLPSSGIDLPWGGTVYIQCDGTQKAVRVQIREEVVLENSPYQPGVLTLQALETKEGGTTPFTPALPTSHLPPLVVKTKQVHFEDTVAGKESVTELVLENIGHASVMWDLSSVAPAYVKAFDNSGNIYRTTYTAFSFHKRSGVAAGMAIIKIPIKFQPRDPGLYSQFWDLQFKQEGLRRVHKQRIEITAKAIRRVSNVESKAARQEDQKTLNRMSKDPQTSQNTRQPQAAGTHPEGTSKKQTSKQQDAAGNTQNRSSLKRSGKPKGVYITESEVHFPETEVGQSNEVKIKVCNDSDEPSLVKIVGPKEPFSVTNVKVTVKPQRFVRLPVKFTPQTASTNYDSVIIFTTTSGTTQQVKVIGRSADMT